MSETRATIAIVRHQISRPFALIWAAIFVIFLTSAFVSGRVVPGSSDTLPIAIVILLALMQPDYWKELRRVAFFAMPLYGRQLARAHVVAPLVLVLAPVLGIELGFAAAGRPPEIGGAVDLLLAAVTTTLIALSKVFRDGWPEALYGIGAFVAGLAMTYPLDLTLPHELAWHVAAAAVIGFFALRAFGETLARYDPI